MAVDECHHSTVAYGVFKGLRFPALATWSLPDRASMILGLYEKEVAEQLNDIPASYDTFIDIGAADGYYGVGVLVASLFEASYCYEMNEPSREAIKSMGLVNDVSDRLVVLGAAEGAFWNDVPSNVRDRSVVLIDIEGGEFSLLSDECLSAFRKSILIIEIHEFFFQNGMKKLEELERRAARYFNITKVSSGVRDPTVFNELKNLSDDDRWLICSERRARLMTWLRLDPIVI